MTSLTPPSLGPAAPLHTLSGYDSPYSSNASDSPPRYGCERTYSFKPHFAHHGHTNSSENGPLIHPPQPPPPAYPESMEHADADDSTQDHTWIVKVRVCIANFFQRRERLLFWLMIIGFSLMFLAGVLCMAVFIPTAQEHEGHPRQTMAVVVYDSLNSVAEEMGAPPITPVEMPISR